MYRPSRLAIKNHAHALRLLFSYFNGKVSHQFTCCRFFCRVRNLSQKVHLRTIHAIVGREKLSQFSPLEKIFLI